MKTHIVYHANCADGFGAAFAAWLKLGDSDATYTPVFYGKPPPKLERGHLVIADFSYQAKTLLDLAQQHESVTVLDHHATAQKDLSPEAFDDLGVKLIEYDRDGRKWHNSGALNIQFDMNRSGAVLAWEYFHPDVPTPEFFLYLQDRDLWKFELPDSREVSMALRSFHMNFHNWVGVSGIYPTSTIYRPGTKTVHPDVSRAIRFLADQGVACRRLTEQQVEIMAKNHRWAVFVPECAGLFFADSDTKLKPGQYLAPVANATVFFSEVGEKLLEMCPEAKFSAYYLDRADGKRQWGLRSRKGFNCAEIIAKPMGGGGHPEAAGFTTNL
jgi:uncharacterized protein